MIPLAYLLIYLLSSNGVEGTIGMNWGRHTPQRLLPSQVVDILLQNGIKEARVYTSQKDILKAFVGSGIKLTIQVFQFKELNTSVLFKKWFDERVALFMESSVWRIYIGNQIFSAGLTDKAFLRSALDTMEMVQNNLNGEGWGELIKVTAPQDSEAILSFGIQKPSQAEFRDSIKEDMIRFTRFLMANNAPFPVEIFIISRLATLKWDMDFGFIDNKSKRVIKDVNGAVYTNFFEFEYDSIIWALEKINASNLKVIVSQIGWPTDGYPGANFSTAEQFYKSFLPYVTSNKGTPKRPGAPIDVYVHALTDEQKLSYKYPHMRHWGIYRSNGEPKYKIDLSGQGRDIYPNKVPGIARMPQRWCVFNGNVKERHKWRSQFDKACQAADCTSLMPGGSCSHLDTKQNVSYAFNMYFQAHFQNETECKFDGLGKVVTTDPSTGRCVFPVEVVEGEQDQFVTFYNYQNGDGGNRLRGNIHVPVLAVYLFSLFSLL